MRRPVTAALSALLLAACSEQVSNSPPPLDAFYFPTGLALTPSPAGETLLVGSSNFDLRYSPASGGTVIAVDPVASLGAPGGTLTGRGAVRVGSYAGPVVVADDRTCPGIAVPQALVASRYTGRLHRVPLTAEGGVAECSGVGCDLALDPDFLDAYPVGVACRADGLRRSALVGYLRTTAVGTAAAGTAWLTQVDLDDPAGTDLSRRTFPLGPGPIIDMAYDATADRLFAVGRFAGNIAPLFVIDLTPCAPADPACENPSQLPSFDLSGAVRGAELTGIALSHPQAGLGRRAYVTARLYDADLAGRIGGRPSFDVGAALLVVDVAEDATGRPAVSVLRVVPIGLGPGQVRVLPPRPGKRDVVVVTNSLEGRVTVYDDDLGAVVRVLSLDAGSGMPEAGREPFALAVEDRGADAWVYVAAFDLSTVSVLAVPLDAPGQADLLRDAGGAPLRIGKERP
jgi:hypothetical protein